MAAKENDPEMQERFREELDSLAQKIASLTPKIDGAQGYEKDSPVYPSSESPPRVRKLENDFKDLEAKSNATFLRIATAIKTRMDGLASEILSLQRQTKDINLKALAQKVERLHRGNAPVPIALAASKSPGDLHEIERRFLRIETRLKTIGEPQKTQGLHFSQEASGQPSVNPKRIDQVEKQIAKLQDEIVEGTEQITASIIARVKKMDLKLKELAAAPRSDLEPQIQKLQAQQHNLVDEFSGAKKGAIAEVERMTALFEQRFKDLEIHLKSFKDQYQMISEPLLKKVEGELDSLRREIRSIDHENEFETAAERVFLKHLAEIQKQLQEIEQKSTLTEQAAIEDFQKRLQGLETQGEERYKKTGSSVDRLVLMVEDNVKEQNKKIGNLEVLEKLRNTDSQKQWENYLKEFDERIENMNQQTLMRVGGLNEEIRERTAVLQEELKAVQHSTEAAKLSLIAELKAENEPLRDLSSRMSDRQDSMNQQLDLMEQKAEDLEVDLEKNLDTQFENYRKQFERLQEKNTREISLQMEALQAKTQNVERKVHEDIEKALSDATAQNEELKGQVEENKRQFLKSQEEALETTLEIRKLMELNPPRLESQIQGVDQRVSKIKKSFGELLLQHEDRFDVKMASFEEIVKCYEEGARQGQKETDALKEQLQQWASDAQNHDANLENEFRVKFKDIESVLADYEESMGSLNVFFKNASRESIEADQETLQRFDKEVSRINLGLEDLSKKNESIQKELTSWKLKYENVEGEKQSLAVVRFESLEKETGDLSAELSLLEGILKHSSEQKFSEVHELFSQKNREVQALFEKTKNVGEEIAKNFKLWNQSEGQKRILEKALKTVEAEMELASREARSVEESLKAKVEDCRQTMESRVGDLENRFEIDREKNTQEFRDRVREFQERFMRVEREAQEIRDDAEKDLARKTGSLSQEFEEVYAEMDRRQNESEHEVIQRDEALRKQQSESTADVRERLDVLDSRLHDMGHRVAHEVEEFCTDFVQKQKWGEDISLLEKRYEKRVTKLEAKIYSVDVVTRGAAEQVAEDMEYEIVNLEKKVADLQEQAKQGESELREFVSEQMATAQLNIRQVENGSLNLYRTLAEAFEGRIEDVGERVAKLEARAEHLNSVGEEEMARRLEQLVQEVSKAQERLAEETISKIQRVESAVSDLDLKQNELKEQTNLFELQTGKRMNAWSADLEIKQHETLIQVTEKLLKRMSGFDQKLGTMEAGTLAETQMLHQKMNRKAEDMHLQISDYQKYSKKEHELVLESFEQENKLFHEQLWQIERRTEGVERALEQKIAHYFENFEGRFQEATLKTMDDWLEARGDLADFGFRFNELVEDLRDLDKKTDASFETINASVQQKTNRLHGRINELNTYQSEFRRDMINRVDDFELKAQGTVDKKVASVSRAMFVRLNFKVFLAVVVIGSACMGFLYVHYLSLAEDVSQKVRSEVGQKFEDEKVQETFQKVVLEKVPLIIQDETSGLIVNLKQELMRQSEEFGDFVETRKGAYQQVHDAMRNELSLLQLQNEISNLENSAINEGDRAAFEKLKKYNRLSLNRETVAAARAAVGRLKTFYESHDRFSSHALTYTGASGFEYRNATIPPEALVYYLRNAKGWKTRAKAAKMLGTWRVQGVGEVLLGVAETDVHLEVVKSALQAFGVATGYQSLDLFDVSAAREWFDVNRKAVNQKLRRL